LPFRPDRNSFFFADGNLRFFLYAALLWSNNRQARAPQGDAIRQMDITHPAPNPVNPENPEILSKILPSQSVFSCHFVINAS
jgi:hypothetical protein